MILTRLRISADLGRGQPEVLSTVNRPRRYLIMTKLASEEQATQNLERMRIASALRAKLASRPETTVFHRALSLLCFS